MANSKTMEGIAVLGDTVYVVRQQSQADFHLYPILADAAAQPLLQSRSPACRSTADMDWPLDVDRLAWNPDGTLHTLSIDRGEIVTYDLSARDDVVSDRPQEKTWA